MKYLALIGMAAALAVTTSASFAQTPPTPKQAMRAQFEQMRSQMQQIRSTERSQILNALTPANRSLLGSVVGGLATSVNPDFRGAASRLDSALSGGEKDAILRAAQSARTQMRSLMQNMRSQFMPNRPEGDSATAPRAGNAGGGSRTPDPGAILLRLATPVSEHGMMRRP